MPLSQRSIIFVCAVFLIFQQLTTGLVCYECQDCPTVDSNSGKKTVGAGYSCFKQTSTYQGNSAVTRGAKTNCETGDTDTPIGIVSLQCCTTDLCNADRSTTDQSNTGVALSTSFSLAIFISAISVIFRAMIIS